MNSGVEGLQVMFLRDNVLLRNLPDYITLNVPPVALSIVPLQKRSLSVRQSYDYF